MSAATSAVLMCVTRSGLRVSHPFRSSACWASEWARSASSSGDRSPSSCSSFWSSSRQRTGSLSPTPRGSKLTRSNRSVSDDGNAIDALARNSRPEPPGPPGFITRDPIRSSADPVDFLRANARSRVGPSGVEGSIGTARVAHCRPACDVSLPRQGAQSSDVAGAADPPEVAGRGSDSMRASSERCVHPEVMRATAASRHAATMRVAGGAGRVRVTPVEATEVPSRRGSGRRVARAASQRVGRSVARGRPACSGLRRGHGTGTGAFAAGSSGSPGSRTV